MVVCKQEEGTNDSEAKVQEEENDTEDRQREFNERRELVHLYVRLSVEHPADILARLRVQQIMLQEEKQRFARKVKVGVKGLTARDSMSLQNAVKCLPPPGQLETPQPGDGWWGGDEDPGWPGDGNGFTFRDATRQQRSQIPWPAMARMWGLLVPDVIGTTMQGFLPVIPPHVVKSVWGDYGWRGGEAVGRRFRDEIDISVNVDTFGDRLLERAEDFFCLFDEDQAAESFQKSIASDEEKDSELKQCVAECMQQEESRRERVRMEEEGSWALGSAGGSSGGEEDEDMKSVPDVAVGDVAPGPDDPVEEVSDPGSSNQSEETIEASDEGDQERGDGIPWYADRRGERVRGQTTREQTERERERLMDDNESEEEEDEDEWWAGGGTGRGGGAGEMELEGPQYGGSGLFEREGGEGEDTGRRVGDDRERGGETGDPNPLWKRLGPQGMEPLKRWDYDEPIDFEGDEAEMMDEDEIRFEGDDAGGSVRAPSVPAPSSILAPSARGQEEEERRSRRDLEPGLLPLPLPSRPPSQFSGGSQHHHLQAAPFLLHSSDHHAAAASWQGGGGGRQEGLLDLPLPLGPPSAVPSAVSSSWFNTQHQHQHQGVYQPPAHQNRPLSPFGSASANPIGGGLGFGTVQEGLLPHPPPSPLPVAPFGAGSGGGDGMRMEGGGEEEEEEDEDPEGFVGDGWDDGSLGGGGGVGQEVPQGFHEHPPHTHIRVSEASPLLQHFPVVSRDEGEREGDEDLVEAGDFSLGEDTLRESRKRSYPFASTTAGAVPLSLPGVQAAALRLPHPSAEFSWLQGGKGEGAGDQRTRGQWEVQGVSQPPPVGAACMLGTESENEESSAEGRYGEAEQTDEHTHKAKKPKTTDTQMTRTEQKDESSSSGMACDHQEAAERPSQHSPFPVEGLESSGPSCFLSKEASEGMLAELLARRPTEMHHREGTEAKVSQKPEAEEMKAAPVLTWAESEELTYRLIDRERDLYMKLATREILEVSKLTRSLPLGLPLRELEDKGAKGKMWACVAIEVVNSLRLHASTPLGAKAVLAALFRHELAPTAPGTGGGERIEEEAKEAERDKIPPAADGEGGEKKFLVSMALQQNFGGEEMHTSAGWFGEGPETSDNMCPSPSTALISSHEREQGGFESTLREEQTSRETGGRGYADWAEDKTKEEEKTSDCWSMHFSTTPVLPVTLRALLMIADMHTSTREFIFDKLCSEMRRQFSPWLFQAGESPSHASSSSSSSFAAVALERDHRRMVVPGRGEWGQRGGAGLETAWGAAGGDGGGRGGLPPSPSLSWAFVGGPLSGRGGRTEGRLHRFDRSSHGEALRRESREAKITCLKKFSQFCNGFRELAALGLFPPVLLFFEDLASSLNDALFVNSLCEAVYRMMPAEGRSPVFMRRNLLRGEGMGGSFGLGKVGKGKGKGGKGKYAKGKGKAKVHANPNRQNSEKRATVDERGDAPSTCTCRNFLRFARAVVDRIDRMLQVVSVPSNEDWGHSFACASSSSSAFSSSFSFAALAEWDRVGETVGMILDKTEEVTTAALEDADQREKTLQAKKDCLEDILFDVQEAQKTFKELDAMLKQVKRLRK
uniref:Uncharacterized protein n=1 Tax=Chromera velia CCMP2878 TaxID=1169474 RepID=A0A0G4HIY6_9ALVE|eukprot:Cvel_28103.t1-p1 / transcript=Cvel_28103.t1 / gene=Cvel_28103 / organism=Chromera_velia_CCMP2878 / gene_product=hypothetical protein / transcript_product=hypothetical protein / location=Cvel_scaffold3619:626-10334(+) / protein_length=1582 / sequence_SO=supercontig / SO=protein_coding / is_pseudo=false